MIKYGHLLSICVPSNKLIYKFDNVNMQMQRLSYTIFYHTALYKVSI